MNLYGRLTESNSFYYGFLSNYLIFYTLLGNFAEDSVSMNFQGFSSSFIYNCSFINQLCYGTGFFLFKKYI